MHPIPHRRARHAALFVLAHGSAPRPPGLPGAPSGSGAGAFHCRLQAYWMSSKEPLTVPSGFRTMSLSPDRRTVKQRS